MEVDESTAGFERFARCRSVSPRSRRLRPLHLGRSRQVGLDEARDRLRRDQHAAASQGASKCAPVSGVERCTSGSVSRAGCGGGGVGDVAVVHRPRALTSSTCPRGRQSQLSCERREDGRAPFEARRRDISGNGSSDKSPAIARTRLQLGDLPQNRRTYAGDLITGWN